VNVKTSECLYCSYQVKQTAGKQMKTDKTHIILSEHIPRQLIEMMKESKFIGFDTEFDTSVKPFRYMLAQFSFNHR